ncbi:MAG: FHA domain-containing protein [Acidimicrobiales bacterium]|nr:FHA domain-containing protein [Actinomycetota bacterium]
MPDQLLTILKFCFLAILYLFFLRVMRAVWAEVKGPPVAVTGAAPAAPAKASRPSAGGGKPPGRLKVVEPAERRGQSYELGEELTVGRAGGCQVTLEDTYASQLHARVFHRDGQFYVEDLGSTNGTFVNRKKVTTPIPIRKGDRLQIGKTVMELS